MLQEKKSWPLVSKGYTCSREVRNGAMPNKNAELAVYHTVLLIPARLKNVPVARFSFLLFYHRQNQWFRARHEATVGARTSGLLTAALCRALPADCLISMLIGLSTATEPVRRYQSIIKSDPDVQICRDPPETHMRADI